MRSEQTILSIKIIKFLLYVLELINKKSITNGRIIELLSTQSRMPWIEFDVNLPTSWPYFELDKVLFGYYHK